FDHLTVLRVPALAQMRHGALDSAQRLPVVHLIVVGQHRRQILERGALHVRAEQSPLPHLAETLLQQIHRRAAVAGSRRLAPLPASVAIGDPPRFTALVHTAEPAPHLAALTALPARLGLVHAHAPLPSDVTPGNPEGLPEMLTSARPAVQGTCGARIP